MIYDVIVIGAGLAGLMAAESAASAGARVLLLAKGLGSLPLTTGCIDVLGYFSGTAKTPLASPAAGIKQLSENHPYRKVGFQEALASFSNFQEILERENHPYRGSAEGNILIPTSLGSQHPTCLVPEAMYHGALSIPGGVLLIGFVGLKDFFPRFSANNLNRLHEQGAISSKFRSALLKRGDLGGKGINGLTLALAFERKEFRDSFVREVRSLLRADERLGVPAVLGLNSSREVWLELQERVGTQVFEIPLPPPSVPGLRLYNLLKLHLQEKGVRLFIGVSKLTPLIEKSRITGMVLGDSRKSIAHRASAFVLATGQFTGGGLDSERGRVFEPLFDLPIRHPANRRDWFSATLLNPEGQPFNEFGVEVDQNLHPVDFQGRAVYANLFAAGGIIAQAKSMTEKSGGGIAIATGYKAGRLAAEFAKKS